VDVDRSLKKYAVLLIAGLFGILVGFGLYTPLDENLIWAALALWVVGDLLIVLSIDRSAYIIGLVRRVLAIASPVLVLFCAFVVLNGALDHHPMVQAETRVVRAYFAGRGRPPTHNYIVVSPSWRQGRDQETFEVHGDFYRDLETGDLVQVEVHRGAFWLPWGPVVTSRTRCPERVYGPPLC